jgi:hypothetical protein
MKKFLLSVVLIAFVLAAHTQTPTIVTPATNCFVFRNFNASDEGSVHPVSIPVLMMFLFSGMQQQGQRSNPAV